MGSWALEGTCLSVSLGSTIHNYSRLYSRGIQGEVVFGKGKHKTRVKGVSGWEGY